MIGSRCYYSTRNLYHIYHQYYSYFMCCLPSAILPALSPGLLETGCTVLVRRTVLLITYQLLTPVAVLIEMFYFCHPYPYFG